jgi:hypothetical protein
MQHHCANQSDLDDGQAAQAWVDLMETQDQQRLHVSYALGQQEPARVQETRATTRTPGCSPVRRPLKAAGSVSSLSPRRSRPAAAECA